MVAKFDPYGTLKIDRGNRILIVFHLYCCCTHKLSTIRMTNVQNLARFVFDSKQYSTSFSCFLCPCMIELVLWDTESRK